jgi:elongation factor G
MIETANAAREALIEMVAEADDALMEKFFDAGTLTQEDLVAGSSAASPRRASSRWC